MGNPDHNAVVYTPCHTDEAGLHTYNFTLPKGMICTDVLPRLGDFSFCKACGADRSHASLVALAVSLSVLECSAGDVETTLHECMTLTI